MANVKITELPQVSSVSATDILPTVASSTTSKITITDLANSLPQVSSSISASYVSGSSAIITSLTSSEDLLIRSTTSGPIKIGRAYYSASNENNLVFGYDTLRSGSTGANLNVAIGDYSLATLVSGIRNVAIGYGALYRATNNNNTAVGSYAAFFTSGSTGFRNNAFGYVALYNNTTGEANTAIGSLSLYANTVDDYNAAIGDFALRYLATGSSNSALGQAAGFALRTGEGNVFIGRGSAPSLLSGSNNTIIGAITPNADINTPVFGLSTGSFNTIIGSNVKALPSILDSNIIIANGLGSIRAWHNAVSWSFSGSVVAPEGFTGSLQGTASWATNAISSSYPIAVTGSTLYSVNPNAGTDFNINQNIFLGEGSGQDSTYTTFGISLGYQAGYQSNFSESYAGNLGDFTASINSIGNQAGYQVSESDDSNFIGTRAGYQTEFSNNSNFIGLDSGYLSKTGNNSNFIGRDSGRSSNTVRWSNLLGYESGYISSDIIDSNFIGSGAGSRSKNISNSNFIGSDAGLQASSSIYSNFIGFSVGLNVTSSYSTLIGHRAGANLSSDKSIGSNNIIIGTNITLEKDRKDSINLGGLIFATGSYSNTGGNPVSGSANGRIGINQPLPQFNLDVSGSGRFTDNLIITGSVGINAISTASLHIKGKTDTGSLVLYTEDTNGSGSFRVYNNGQGISNPGAYSSRGNEIFGRYAMMSSSFSSSVLTQNTAVGLYSMWKTDTSLNSTAIGYGAMAYAISFVSPISSSTAVGNQALLYQVGGIYNVAIGNGAMQGGTTIGSGNSGDRNTAVGATALKTNTTGQRNNAFGDSSLGNNSVGSFNTANGNRALLFNTSGSYNSAIGIDALRNNITASYGTAIGGQSLYDSLTGDRNIAIGWDSGRGITSGRANTIIGSVTGLPANLSNTIILADGDGNVKMRFESGSLGSISTSIIVTGSVEITNVLTLPPQDPLPSVVATGSIAVSGSGVDCKPYFWNGSTWTSMI